MRDTFYLCLLIIVVVLFFVACGIADYVLTRDEAAGACTEQKYLRLTNRCGDFAYDVVSIDGMEGTNCRAYGDCLVHSRILNIKCRVPNDKAMWGAIGVDERNILFDVYGRAMCIETYIAE